MNGDFWQTFKPVTEGTPLGARRSRATQKVRKQLVIPAFNVGGISWVGVSHVVYTIRYNAGISFTLPAPVVNFMNNCSLCVTWEADGIRTRYELWSGSGEELSYPKYNGETIPAEFDLEFWNIFLFAQVFNPAEYRMPTSILELAETCCQELGSDILGTVVIREDDIFEGGPSVPPDTTDGDTPFDDGSGSDTSYDSSSGDSIPEFDPTLPIEDDPIIVDTIDDGGYDTITDTLNDTPEIPDTIIGDPPDPILIIWGPETPREILSVPLPDDTAMIPGYTHIWACPWVWGYADVPDVGQYDSPVLDVKSQVDWYTEVIFKPSFEEYLIGNNWAVAADHSTPLWLNVNSPSSDYSALTYWATRSGGGVKNHEVFFSETTYLVIYFNPISTAP